MAKFKPEDMSIVIKVKWSAGFRVRWFATSVLLVLAALVCPFKLRLSLGEEKRES